MAVGTSQSQVGGVLLGKTESGIFLAIKLLCNFPPDRSGLEQCVTGDYAGAAEHEDVACQCDWIRVNGLKNLLCACLDSGLQSGLVVRTKHCLGSRNY